LSIRCDLEWAPAYRYSEYAEDAEQLEQEAQAAQRLGVDATFTVELPSWCSASSGVRFARQGMFDPVRFLEGLIDAFVSRGGRLFEHCRVTDYHEDERATVQLVTEHNERVLADRVVLATHTPINVNLVQAMVAPYQSYVVAFRSRDIHDAALFWDYSDTPYHYIRPAHTAQDDRLLIVGGEDHKAGDGSDPEKRYATLEAWARRRFTLGPSVARWSDIVYEPADGVPYIGQSPLATSVLIATGFSGVGLVGGAAASDLISSEIAGRPKPWASLFSPTRFKPITSARSVLTETATLRLQRHRETDGRTSVPLWSW
jgi:glycine/D-amino acid oxidase-like deaminating enzyme